MCRLGQQLHARTAEVLERTIADNESSGLKLDPAVEQRFQRLGEVSTFAVASWIGERARSRRSRSGRRSGRSSASWPPSVRRRCTR